jgi:hypothetical protein
MKPDETYFTELLFDNKDLDHYQKVTGPWVDQKCLKCHPKCFGCTGPGEQDCLGCQGNTRLSSTAAVKKSIQALDPLSTDWIFTLDDMNISWTQVEDKCSRIESDVISNLVLNFDSGKELPHIIKITAALLELDTRANDDPKTEGITL